MPARRQGPPPPGVRRRPPVDPQTEVIHYEDELPLEDEELYEDDYDEYEDEFYDDEDEAALEEEERAEPEYIEGDSPQPRRGRRKKKLIGRLALVAIVLLLADGVWYGVTTIFGCDDFEGVGEGDVLVQVSGGDSTNAIAGKLETAGVVASAKAFAKASEDVPAVTKVQPGYYLLKQKMSGAAAAEQIVKPGSRVGQLQIRAGTPFDDITQPDGKVTEGVFTLMSKASCADINGKSTCVPVDELRKTVESIDLTSIGVPGWAAATASKAERKNSRLEGLITPGVYDVKPGWTATELLTDVVKISPLQLQRAGLTDKTGIDGKTPYQTLVIASIIEREAVKIDFGKISRVIYNRLNKNMKLEVDSTINYVLDKPTLLTKPEDRAKAGPYNTYANTGLPPTPIGAPSKEAIQAALQPAAGDWLFFVKCEKSGQSCFAVTNAEHNKNRDDAQARGVY